MSGYNIKAIDAELECLNGRIADRNATIASQAAEIEELEAVMLDLEKEATRAWFYWVANECKSQNALDFAEMVMARVSAALQPKEGEG
jgi:hypothetical protein